MRQAIITKYLPPTNSRGARVKAKCYAGSVTIPWDDALDVDDNHTAAAVALCKKLGWRGELHGGGLPDGAGNAYVFEGSKPDAVV